MLQFTRAPDKIVYHNRDIEKNEVEAIIKISRIREQAFFSFMAQSGPRPETICKLKLRDLEPLDKAPCKVDVSSENTKGEYGAYFTFIGEDTIKYLKDYLSARAKKGPNDYVFTNISETGPMNRSNPSRIFQDLAEKLRETGELKYETKVQGKPADLRLYCLRKYFQRMAQQAGSDYVNFWMGHALPQSSDKHYFPGKGENKPSQKVIEEHRSIYAEKAMPFLRLEAASPSETEKTIEELRKENAELGSRIIQTEERFSNIERMIQDLKKQIPEP